MMTKTMKKIAFLFPGQGAQYPRMARDFFDNFSVARLTFEEADDLLKHSLSSIIFEGSEKVLTETQNSQTGIYVVGIAILRVLKELFDLQPFVCAGLSLGEYTALTAAEWLSFQQALPLVQRRAQLMNDICEAVPGAMAVVLGLDADVVEKLVRDVNLPNDLWVANFNCPGQVVISGTPKGIHEGTLAAKSRNAKRIVPLPVHGAFHSGVMQPVEERLAPYIKKTPLQKGSSKLVMNVPGNFVQDMEQIRSHLIKQITHSVRWEQGIRAMEREEIDLYIEFGPGKTLSAMNKRIGVKASTVSIETIEDLKSLSSVLSESI